jgi:hypothetical protein
MLSHSTSYCNITVTSHGDEDVDKMAEEKTGGEKTAVFVSEIYIILQSAVS